MSKFGANSFIVFLFCGLLILIWSAYDFAFKTYRFSSQGVEQEIIVVKKDHVSGTSKGGNTYYYQVEILGNQAILGFSVILQEGEKYSVLVLGSNEEVILGKRTNSLFEIFSAQVGGKFYAGIFIAVYMFLFLTAPKAILEVFKNRKKLYQLC